MTQTRNPLYKLKFSSPAKWEATLDISKAFPELKTNGTNPDAIHVPIGKKP